MGSFLGGFLLPLLLLTAALINWSLISLTDLLLFLFIQFNADKIGFIFGRRFLVLWPIIIFSSLVILVQVTFLVIWSLEGYQWSIANAWWAKLIGFMTIQSWKSPSVIYFLVVQLLSIFVAAADIFWYRIGFVQRRDSCWVHLFSFVDHLGSHLRVASCLLLPAIQIIVGISHPSWVSLPFFIGSCVGLVDWSLTSNFLGLFRWWRPLQLYAGFIIFLVYVYQLPVEYPSMLKWVAGFIGLFKVSSTPEWPGICSYISLILFYIMLSCVKCDLEEMDFIMSMRESNLVEQLLPSKHSFFIRELRSGVKHTNVLLRREVFRTFTINFFTYGFPVSLVVLSFWSFHFASLCAFGLLAYVGFIVYAFPSLFQLHRLNGLLLVFILFWAISTYIFNVAFTFLNRKIGKDMDVWEMVGLWHYPIPGFFLLAQFCLGILVALVNLVNNSVFLCVSDEDERSSNDNCSAREASSLQNCWQSLAVLIVMQLYSYERRQSRYNSSDEPEPLEYGRLGFVKRFLSWHSDKILFASLFYASISPISAFGLLYLLGLGVCSTLPKISHIPSKLFLAYTGVIMTAEYLFQMWGKQAGMFPGQKHSNLSYFLGFRVFEPGFWGLELGLRGKVLIIAACTLQYNVFRWLERVPGSVLNKGKWDDPCPLFVSDEDDYDISISHEKNNPSLDAGRLFVQQEGSDHILRPSFVSSQSQVPHSASSKRDNSECSSTSKYSFGFTWGSTKECHKWDKMRIIYWRKERFEMQKIIFKIYMKFWMENLFHLFGLEITMISLLLASFAVLNSVSLFYVGLLAACILLDRGIIRKLWPIFVFLFASILILEYIAFWMNMWNSDWNMPSKAGVHCHDCWRISNLYFQFCLNCWLGLTVDDSRMLFSYFVVFMLSSLKLRADHLSGFSLSSTYRKMVSHRKNTFVWRDLSFETKSMWTILDYLRLYCYCHLLDLVLALILITGTLEYDVLHLGYLAFALVFFRLRLEILKKKNKVFKFLRAYNFALIILSLAYQSPLVGEVSAGKCETMHYIFEMIGFYKYDYGFRITARSALVEIIIFMLVSLQSYMFSLQEFEYVCRYLEAEQIGAIVHEQEKKAAWKTEQLQHIRDSEESKRKRNLQVEKMKSEMLNFQIQLHNMNSSFDGNNASSPIPGNEFLRKQSTSRMDDDAMTSDIEGTLLGKVEQMIRTDSSPFPELQESLANLRTESRMHSMEFSVPEICEIDSQISDISLDLDRKRKHRSSAKGNPLMSAVQFIGDGVSQVQSIGNQAVSNLASFLNVTQDDDMMEQGNTEDRVYDQIESQETRYTHFERSSSLQSDKSSDPATMQLGRIFRHIWSQMRSNNDVVCYCCFILVFLWNFSLLSMVYLAALFVYALCVNTGPGYMFWVIMLIYTELYILLQYLYQIIIQHCGLTINSDLLQELGFPTHRITSSFVISSLPLFLVYLFTLLQSSITAKDGEWTYSNAFNKNDLPRKHSLGHYGLTEKAYELLHLGEKMMMFVLRSLCKYWKSLTKGAESPPYFIQVSIDVQVWPEYGIQPERIESGINQMLQIIHDGRCKEQNPRPCPFSSRVHVQSIERSKENAKMALVVLEVVYSSPSTDTCAEWYDSLTPAADVTNEIRLAQHKGLVENTGFPYQILSVIGGGKREIDLYAYVFGADLIVFFFVAIFYQSVIKNNTEFLDVYQLEDQFPKEFVFILMIIFFLIVLDRCIYLCSFAIGKVIFYLFNLVLFTYAVTKYAWQMEPSNQHAGELALRAIFLAKAVSLALQAIQIRYGLPHKSTLYRQFLTSEVSRINYLGYRLYRALPFLYELRCVLDWSCTTTSLTMYDWLKLEDINASLYLVKCDAVLNRSQHKQGAKQTMYSSGNPTNVANPIKDASCQVDIKTSSGRLTLYQTTLCEKIKWEKLNANMVLDPGGYLSPYNRDDIQLICCQADASVLWLVPGVVQSRFIHSLDWNQDISIAFTWLLTRDRPKGKEVVRYDRLVHPRDLPNQSDIQKVLNGSMNSFQIKNVYERYFRVTGSGDVRPLEQEDNFVSADLILNRENYDWWSFHDIQPINVSKCGHFTGPVAIVISEEIPPQGILGDTLSKFSIWGLYITFVLAVGRFIRLQCSDLRMRIPYENLPSCDRLIAICEDIYAARAEGELGVEEVLYWTLVKIYRSPHMLLEYTKID
ncbi:Piezo-type mechanosensitive ion channel-like protein, partial [Cucurbita argyrosperma subsp. sororia]